MDGSPDPVFLALAGAGIAAGLWLLARGLGSRRTAIRIGDTSPSRIASLAAGEVRVSGVIEPAEVTLVSPLQSAACVYYRAEIEDADGDDWPGGEVEERAVGFRIRDETGAIRCFPGNAAFDVPVRFDATTDVGGGEPSALQLRTGGPFAEPELDRDAAIARLLTVRHPGLERVHPLLRGTRGTGRRRYREARLEPGDTVTVLARAMPFGDLQDPAEADVAMGSALPADDPEVAMNIAEARQAGLLVGDAATAWGNAAIPGFGIGQPTRAPALDPRADRPAVVPEGEAATSAGAARFEIPPEALVLAGAPGVPLVIAAGAAGAAVARHEDRLTIGLLGAVLAIGSAVVLAVLLADGIAP